MKAMLYIIGEPGVGKSTLIEWLTEGHPYEETDSPFAFRRYDCGVTELGKRRDQFSGTDALAMDVQPKVVNYLASVAPALVLAEGDRLANGKFFDSVRQLGYDLTVVLLVGAAVAERQRVQRGNVQNESWIRGRQTKVFNLSMDPDVFAIEAGMPLGYYAEVMLDPVTTALIGGK